MLLCAAHGSGVRVGNTSCGLHTLCDRPQCPPSPNCTNKHAVVCADNERVTTHQEAEKEEGIEHEGAACCGLICDVNARQGVEHLQQPQQRQAEWCVRLDA